MNIKYTLKSQYFDIPVLDTLLVKNVTLKMDIRRHFRDLG